MNFFCIADEDTVRGFRLAGVPGQAVFTAPEAAVAVENAAAKSECAIIIITQKVAAGIRQQVETIRLERSSPLIVEIAGPEGPVTGRKGLRQLVQEAIGIHVGLDETT